MGYETFRVEATRNEAQADLPVTVEITAYLDRVPETREPTRGMLTRASRGVWNSRLQFTGDFDSFGAAIAAIEAAYPEIARIRCYEYAIDDEFAREVAPLVKTGGEWRPAE